MRLINTCFLTLFISTSATADWCDGSQWMFVKMPMETRVTDAIADLNALTVELLAEEKRLKNKVSVNSRSLREQLTGQYSTLKNQTIALCKSPQKSSFPFTYQQVELKSTTDYKNQLNLNLGLLSSQRQMINALKEEESGFKQHIKQLSAYRNKALLLNQQTKIQQRSPVSALQFIQQACGLKQQITNELEITNDILINAVLDQQLADLEQQPIDHDALGHFIKNCKLAPIQQQMQANAKSWWRVLY
jgi:hypothetical protein